MSHREWSRSCAATRAHGARSGRPAAVARSTCRATTACPTDGPAILCPNHISFLDSAFLMLTLPRNISFVGKAEYMDSWKTKYVFPAHGHDPHRPLRRREVAVGARHRGGRAAARRAVRHLPRGHAQPRRPPLQGAHRRRPAGPRDRLPDLPGRRSSAPTPSSRPGAKAPKPFKHCSITIGRPVRPERYRDRREPHLAWRSMIDEVMFEIREMTGQDVPQPLRRRVASSTPPRSRCRPPGTGHRSAAGRPERELVGAERVERAPRRSRRPSGAQRD